MSWLWLKNLAGCKLTDDEMRDIKHPYVELYTHVMGKSIQAFGMIGTVVLGPAVAMMNANTRNLVGVRSSAFKFGKYGVMLGIVAGPLMTYARLKSSGANDDAVYDRSYRLRNNRGQLRVDRGSIVGAVGGFALALPLATCPVTGALFGMSAGIISMAIYNNAILKNEEKPKKKDK